jgi:hypothetical protein
MLYIAISLCDPVAVSLCCGHLLLFELQLQASFYYCANEFYRIQAQNRGKLSHSYAQE